jgi:hypothetical protein
VTEAGVKVRFQVLVSGNVDGKLKLSTKSDKAARYVCAGYGSAVPCIKE